MADDQVNSYPTEYRGIPIPETLRPNWHDNRPEVTWWRAGVDAASPEELEGFRNRVVHGWAFRVLGDAEVEGIRAYLRTGNPETLPETYKRVRRAIISQKERYKGFSS